MRCVILALMLLWHVTVLRHWHVSHKWCRSVVYCKHVMTLKVATPFFLTKWIATIYSWVTYQRTASLWKQSKLPCNKVTHCVEPIPDISTGWGFTTVFMCMHAHVLHFNLHRQVRTHNVPSHTHTHTHTHSTCNSAHKDQHPYTSKSPIPIWYYCHEYT